MTDFTHVIHTQIPGRTNTPVKHAFAIPDSLNACIVKDDNNAGIMLTFSAQGKDTHYVLDEMMITALQKIFTEALPLVMEQSKPQGIPT